MSLSIKLEHAIDWLQIGNISFAALKLELVDCRLLIASSFFEATTKLTLEQIMRQTPLTVFGRCQPPINKKRGAQLAPEHRVFRIEGLKF